MKPPKKVVVYMCTKCGELACTSEDKGMVVNCSQCPLTAEIVCTGFQYALVEKSKKLGRKRNRT